MSLTAVFTSPLQLAYVTVGGVTHDKTVIQKVEGSGVMIGGYGSSSTRTSTSVHHDCSFVADNKLFTTRGKHAFEFRDGDQLLALYSEIPKGHGNLLWAYVNFNNGTYSLDGSNSGASHIKLFFWMFVLLFGWGALACLTNGYFICAAIFGFLTWLSYRPIRGTNAFLKRFEQATSYMDKMRKVHSSEEFNRLLSLYQPI